jgi:hypothetical protein
MLKKMLGLAVGTALLGSTAQAATIMKLSLGATTADLGMVGGALLTLNDGNGATTGMQNTAIDFVGPLGAIPDVLTESGSFTLGNLTATGPAQTLDNVVVQDFTGGSFSVYDPANILLLSGNLGNSALTGTIGAPGTGSVFTTSAATITGGTLAPQFVANSLSLSVSLLSVNAGTGFAVTQTVLQPFSADAQVTIAADPIPEPASIGVMTFALAGLAMRRRSSSR